MEKKIIRTYFLLTLIKGIGISFISATYVVFLMSHGLNLFEVNLVNLVFFTTLFIAEIPTGAIADVFGRKLSYVLSFFLWGSSMLVYYSSETFVGFAIAEIIGAMGATFASGAFQAWLVDTLNYHGFRSSLSPIFSKEQQITGGAAIVGALAGAYLADIEIGIPRFMGGCILIAGGIIAVKLMKEEYFVPQRFSFIESLRAMRETAKKSFEYASKHRVVRLVLFMGGSADVRCASS